jgi:hypothetical protein
MTNKHIITFTQLITLNPSLCSFFIEFHPHIVYFFIKNWFELALSNKEMHINVINIINFNYNTNFNNYILIQYVFILLILILLFYFNINISIWYIFIIIWILVLIFLLLLMALLKKKTL